VEPSPDVEVVVGAINRMPTTKLTGGKKYKAKSNINLMGKSSGFSTKFNVMRNGIPFSMKGTFCQKVVDNELVFLEFHVCEYDMSLISRLEKLDIHSESEIGSYLQLISDTIPVDTEFLYKLESYNADERLKSIWEFNESITNYEIRGFTSISGLLEYCSKKWGIEESDFTTQDQTSIP